MKNFEELNFYEILEISVDASPFKIKRAYKNALEVYDKDSLLTYTLFSDEERVDILKRNENAYNTLIDKTKRTAYDASLTEREERERGRAKISGRELFRCDSAV
jgi:DnaJ-class molecular chaperone